MTTIRSATTTLLLALFIYDCASYNVVAPQTARKPKDVSSGVVNRADFCRSVLATVGCALCTLTSPTRSVAAAPASSDNKLDAGLEALRKEKARVQKEASKEIKKAEKQYSKEIKTIKKEVKKVEKKANKEIKTIKKEVKKETKQAEKEFKKVKKGVTKDFKKVEKVVSKETQNIKQKVNEESERAKKEAASKLGVSGNNGTPPPKTGIDVSKVKVCDGVKVKCL